MNQDISLDNFKGIEWYAKYFNEVLYPSKYPYKLMSGIGTDGNKLYLTIQIHTAKGMLDALRIWGDTDEEILDAFNKLEFENSLKCLVNDNYNEEYEGYICKS